MRTLPAEKATVFTKFVNATVDPCNGTAIQSVVTQIAGCAVLVNNNQSCTYTRMGYLLEQNGKISMAVFLVDKYYDILFDPRFHTVTIEGIQVLLGDYPTLAEYNEVGLFDPTIIKRIDPNVLFLLLTALLCVVLGMWWGVCLFIQSICLQAAQSFKVSLRAIEEDEIIDRDNKSDKRRRDHDPAVPESTSNVGILGLVFFFAVVCGAILLAYFFPEVVGYLIYVLYGMASLSSLTICLMSILDLFPIRIRSYFGRKLYKSNSRWLPTIKMNFLCSFPLAALVVILFFSFRFTSRDVWVIQNLLGIAICTVFIANARLKRFHTIVIIYVFFIVYDIFFVFITPHIDIFNKDPTTTTTTTTLIPTTTTTTTLSSTATPTSSGTTGNITFSTMSTTTTLTTSSTTIRTTTTTTLMPTTTTRRPSVMEYVALGLGTTGSLPLTFTYPYIRQHPDPCRILAGFSVLGLGDVFVPGLLGVYCAIFDYIKGNRRTPVYSITFCISYIVGLSATFIALAHMDTAQPALLYIVPATLVATIVLSIVRKDIKDLFAGHTLKVVSQEFTPNNDAEKIAQ